MSIWRQRTLDAATSASAAPAPRRDVLVYPGRRPPVTLAPNPGRHGRRVRASGRSRRKLRRGRRRFGRIRPGRLAPSDRALRRTRVCPRNSARLHPRSAQHPHPPPTFNALNIRTKSDTDPASAHAERHIATPAYHPQCQPTNLSGTAATLFCCSDRVRLAAIKLESFATEPRHRRPCAAASARPPHGARRNLTLLSSPCPLATTACVGLELRLSSQYLTSSPLPLGRSGSFVLCHALVWCTTEEQAAGCVLTAREQLLY